jgi:hypothetical protein
MSDPLTALKHAVQVMNVLNMLIMKELKNRRDSRSQQSNTNPNSQMNSTEHQNASGEVKSHRTRNADNQNTSASTSIGKGSRNLPTERDKVEEISDEGEPLWDKKSRQNGKINRIDSVVEHLEAFW